MRVLELIRDIPELQAAISGMQQTKTEAELIGSITGIVMPLIDRFIPYISEMLDGQLDEKYLDEECGLSDHAEILYTILEVNRIRDVMVFAKKGEALFKVEKSTKAGT